MVNEKTIEPDNQGLKVSLETCWQRGKEALMGAKKIIRNYAIQEKVRGGRLTDAAKTGILAYHYNCADQAWDRLEKLPPEQTILGNELQDIRVSMNFVQKIAPNMNEWERLHYFQYGTTVEDLSGRSVEAVKALISSVYITAWMGIVNQKFKEKSTFFERISSKPLIIPSEGPVMIFRKLRGIGRYCYSFDPKGIDNREKE
ncbi:MAG: hypothetical protein SPL08_00300 [Pseudomonadota bacterium]|nr:hypothetical protein [Pseudomonadota bacterium]